MSTKTTSTVRVSPEILQVNRHAHFEVGEQNFAGQRWIGTLTGREQVGQRCEVHRQIDAEKYEYSHVEVVARETPVTGAVLLTVRESVTIAKERA